MPEIVPDSIKEQSQQMYRLESRLDVLKGRIRVVNPDDSAAKRASTRFANARIYILEALDELTTAPFNLLSLRNGLDSSNLDSEDKKKLERLMRESDKATKKIREGYEILDRLR